MYHPQTGTFIVGQGNSNTNWGLYTDAGGYSDTRVTSYSTTSTIPTGATNFTLALGVSSGVSTRTVNYRSTDFTVSLERAGAFWERLPLVVWPGGAQATDVITFTLDGGGTQTAGEETVTVNATVITVTRAGLGVLTVTLDQARSVTLSSVSETAADPYFSAARRQVRHLDIASTETLSYAIAITLA